MPILRLLASHERHQSQEDNRRLEEELRPEAENEDVDEELRKDGNADSSLHLAVLRESEVILHAALNEREMPKEMLELRTTMGWDEPRDADQQSNELLMFYLTLRSGILVEEARVAWVEEALPVLRNRATKAPGAKRAVPERRRGKPRR